MEFDVLLEPTSSTSPIHVVAEAPIWPDDEITKELLQGIEESRQRANLEDGIELTPEC